MSRDTSADKARPTCSRPRNSGGGSPNAEDAEFSGIEVEHLLVDAMMLRWSLDLDDAATRVEAAVDRAVSDGVATRNIGGEMSTAEVTAAVIERMI